MLKMVVKCTMKVSLFVILVSTVTTISVHGFSTTLEGPFKPETAPLDPNLNPVAFDLPESDPSFVQPNSEFQPEQISVSLSYSFDSVWISWVTGEFQIGEEDSLPLDPNSVQSIVQYREFNVLTRSRSATGHSIVYNQQYPPQNGLKNYTSGIIDHVQLTNLKPSTLYRYQCGDPSVSAMSKEYYFRTMPKSTSENYPHRIVVAGDLGLTYNTSATLRSILSNHPDLVVLIGGFSYADTYLTNNSKLHCSSCQCGHNGSSSDCDSCYSSGETYQPRWDYWGRFMEPLTANVPTMMVAGDHEIELQIGSNLTFSAYSSRFTFPSKESGSFSPLYYSFNAGGAHFIVLNSYTPYDNSSDQYIWLERDLRNIDRSETPWVVATWSLPWYSTFKGYYREAEPMRLILEDLLYSYRVDIIFNSQVDAYERSNRVYNYALDQCGPVYISTGAGGAGKLDIEHVDDPGNCPDPSQNYSCRASGFNFTLEPISDEICPVKQPDYSAYRESSFGFGMLEVKNETHALWSWNRNQNVYYLAADIIYIVRQPDICPVYN
ncbi:PREDICTED: purple acid phosphatase 13-like [Camelina sativa]|uniref:Purple acid phosphatase n=1 Tax=Camelina sativa TaxID=90675 RepID=A0ABM0WDJ2_CAMSA|nr:PREDICTED: purple acid phosphatase 13-like [Camelina sativa]